MKKSSKYWQIIIMGVIFISILYYISAKYWGKTLWDWLELLIIPIVLSAVAFWFTSQERKNDREAMEQRDKTDRAIAADTHRESNLQNYYDKMTELLLDKDLRNAQRGDEILIVARTRTLTTLQSLDNVRKGSLIKFLYEAKLISLDIENRIPIGGADLTKANLGRTVLYEADFSGVNLNEADFSETILGNASFCYAKLIGVNFKGSDLENAKFHGSDLTGALNLTNDQLATVDSLWNATMPDGKKYNPKIHTDIVQLRKNAGLDEGNRESLF